MIAKAHENGVEVNCWTADYTRTEIAEALSLDILAKSGCDYITTDQWYDLK
jgi:glycerophosphoryl diester phosphodiesterase